MNINSKCNLIRSIKRQIAENNGIIYKYKDCEKEDCNKKCERCIIETEWLNDEINRKIDEGKEFILPQFSLEKIFSNVCVNDLEDSTIYQDVNKIYDMKIEELNLSVRAYNCLHRVGINTIDELTDMNIEEIMNIKNLGKETFKELKAKMDQIGVGFRIGN